VIGTIVALMLVSPALPVRMKSKPLHCLSICKGQYDDNIERCWYDESETCDRICVDTKTRMCLPVIVRLGEWNAVPIDYVSESYDENVYPTSTFVSHLADAPQEESVTYDWSVHQKEHE